MNFKIFRKILGDSHFFYFRVRKNFLKTIKNPGAIKQFLKILLVGHLGGSVG